MSTTDLLANGLEQNLGFLQMTLADFSDADLLVRPVPNANHTAWQLGHLTVSEREMLSPLAGKAMPELPAGFAARFTKETSGIDDAKAFPTKAELLAQFAKVRAGTVAWVKTLKESDLAAQSPEMMRQWCPTVGSLIGMTPVHVAMHIGQFQVIRRKLGKPILF